uniref:Uncharacterized protein n=1 Tax=Plectus sambesii TaxID=2011161 RepID=A0A914VDN3_9BILA
MGCRGWDARSIRPAALRSPCHQQSMQTTALWRFLVVIVVVVFEADHVDDTIDSVAAGCANAQAIRRGRPLLAFEQLSAEIAATVRAL